MNSRRRAALGSIALLAILLLAGFAVPGASGTRGTIPSADARVAASLPVLDLTGSGAATKAPSDLSCSDNLAHAQSFGALSLPPTVAPNLQSPCVVGVDENSLSVLSNSSTAGSRFTVALALPSSGTSVGSVLASWSLRFWTSGVPCSVDQATQVEIQLIPPMGPYRGGPSLNWSAQAPAYDLVPPGSCDPTCTNASALITLGGAAYCEDQVVLPKLGGPPLVPSGSFAPGDTLALTVVGNVGGSEGLQVYLNDTDHPAADLYFGYSGGVTLSGLPLVPRYARSATDDPVWGVGPGVAAVVENCPTVGAPLVACTSYNAESQAGTSSVRILSEFSWNASTLSYSDPYEAYASASSTEQCQSSLIRCAGFGAPGEGSYPTWGLYGGTGAPWLAYGGPSAGEVRSLTEAFDASGAASYQPFTTITRLAGPFQSGGFNVSARVTDPSGILAVIATLDSCNATAGGSVSSMFMVLSPGPANTSLDGVWSVSMAANAAQVTVPFWVTAQAADGRWSPISIGQAVQTGGSCVLLPPPAPTLTPSDVQAISGGYLVHWNESSAAAVGFMVNLTSPLGPNASFAVGPVRSLRADIGVFAGGSSGGTYSISITALNADGVASGASSQAGLPSTLDRLTLRYTESPTTNLWVGSSMLTVNATVGGTVGPYLVTAEFGDGLSAANGSVNSTFTIVHDYAGYFGRALLSLTVEDPLGDTLSTMLAPIWIAATPLGMVQFASAGDGVVNLTFNRPVSPVAPALRFAVTWTSDADLAWELGAAALSNHTVPGVFVWNTTVPYYFLAAADNATVFLEVRAWNAFGLGGLPNAFTPVTATPRPLQLSAITALTGGLAPYTDAFAATATAGSNTTLVNVLYTYPGGSVAPTPLLIDGTFYLNSSITFPSPGSFVVVLHVVDAFFDIAITTIPIFVAPGLAPALSADVLNAPAYAAAPVDLQATASGGSGIYQFNWSFGDGSQASGSNPVHAFALSGSYTVVVRCLDLRTGGLNTTTLPLTVYSLPVLFLSVTQGPNGSLSYEFRASVGGGSGNSTVVWTFGDGTVGRGATVMHDYRDMGIYEINVSATDPAGRAGSAQFNLSAFPSPGSSGASAPNGLSLLDTILLVAAAGFAALTVLLILWRGRPPESEPAPEDEDGAVSLT